MTIYVSTRLPSAYQEVEYIQSSGTQYINTGMTFSNNTSVDFTIAFTSSRSGWSGVIGCQYYNVADSWAIGISQSAMTYQQATGYVDVNFSPTLNQKYKFTTSGNKIYRDGSLMGTASSSASFTTPASAYIFRVNYTSSTGFSYNVSARLYYCKIYNSGTLVRDFVPCYRKSDSVIGMYDLVNNAFYGNSGTGTFTKGADVTSNAEVTKVCVGKGESWDMSKWTLVQSVSISSYFSQWSGGCAFNPNGTKVYISGYDNGTKVKQFSLSTAYDLTTMSLDKSITIQAEDLFFKSDGTVLYTVGTSNGSPRIYKNDLTTPRDIGSYTTTSYSLGPYASRSFWISDDGTRAYIGSNTSGIYGYTLSTPYNLSTATKTSQTTSVNAVGIWLKPDGTMLFCDQGEGYSTFIYGNLSTPRDLSTLTNAQTASIHGSNEASGKRFNDIGTMALFVGGGSNTNYITKYTL